jgi:hypothetical protein
LFEFHHISPFAFCVILSKLVEDRSPLIPRHTGKHHSHSTAPEPFAKANGNSQLKHLRRVSLLIAREAGGITVALRRAKRNVGFAETTEPRACETRGILRTIRASLNNIEPFTAKKVYFGKKTQFG